MAEEKNIRLKCIYGNKVRLKNLRTGKLEEYTLVTFSEEKPGSGYISNYTELGRAIWAKHEGDEVSFTSAGKPQSYLIEKIENA